MSYSNLIASGTNIAVTAITRDFSKLDIGGLAVTIYRLITDAKFIREVKEVEMSIKVQSKFTRV